MHGQTTVKVMFAHTQKPTQHVPLHAGAYATLRVLPAQAFVTNMRAVGNSMTCIAGRAAWALTDILAGQRCLQVPLRIGDLE